MLGNHDFADSRDPFSKPVGEFDLGRGTLLFDEAATVEVRGHRLQLVGVDPRTYMRLAARPWELADPTADLLLDTTARQRGQIRAASVKRMLDEHVSGRADHGHRLWCLVMLELWQRTWVEAARPAEAAAAVS